MGNIQLVYSEKDIEDILAENCEHFLGIKYLKRQFRTPNGVIDILASNPDVGGVYYVVEIKKGRLDAAAYTQVLRYSQWLTSELSKNGKRAFIPLLVGQELGDDLLNLCEYFEPDEHRGEYCYGRVFYRLFNFCPMRGVQFTWINTRQKEYRQSLFHYYNPYERLDEQLGQLQYELDTVTVEQAVQESRTVPVLVK